jgi:hypothetical protein
MYLMLSSFESPTSAEHITSQNTFKVNAAVVTIERRVNIFRK